MHPQMSVLKKVLLHMSRFRMLNRAMPTPLAALDRPSTEITMKNAAKPRPNSLAALPNCIPVQNTSLYSTYRVVIRGLH